MQTIQNQLRATAAFIMALVMLCSCGNAGKKIMQKAQQKSVEKELADPETWKNPDAAAETTRRYNALKAEIEKLYEQYDVLEGEM